METGYQAFLACFKDSVLLHFDTDISRYFDMILKYWHFVGIRDIDSISKLYRNLYRHKPRGVSRIRIRNWTFDPFQKLFQRRVSNNFDSRGSKGKHLLQTSSIISSLKRRRRGNSIRFHQAKIKLGNVSMRNERVVGFFKNFII